MIPPADCNLPESGPRTSWFCIVAWSMVHDRWDLWFDVVQEKTHEGIHSFGLWRLDPKSEVKSIVKSPITLEDCLRSLLLI